LLLPGENCLAAYQKAEGEWYLALSSLLADDITEQDAAVSVGVGE